MSQRFYLSLLAVGMACIVAVTPISRSVTAAAVAAGANNSTVANAGTPGEAARALAEGTAFLRRNRADLALPLLESALKLFTEANDGSGLAAAHDALGDINLRHGQYNTALEHFQRAADAFSAGNETANAALLYAKIGEANYLAGNEEAARTAFARIGEQKNASGTKVSGGSSGNSDTSGATTFAAISAAVPGLLSCASLKPKNDSSNNNSNNTSNSSAGGGGAASNTPTEGTLGHGLRGRSRSVRMDLRVVDQNGNPVPGVKSKLSSERQSNGFSCDCQHTTDALGKVLMDPIHFTKTLKLKLEAKGFEPQMIDVDPSQLDKPFKAVMQAKGAVQGAAGAAQNAAQAQKAASQGQNAMNAPASSCFDFYRLFVAYGTSELGLGRADFNKNQLGTSRAHYENILAAADANAPGGNLTAARLFRAVARTSLGDIALRQDRYADALKFYGQAAEIARQDGRAELTWGAQRGLGKTYWTMAAGGGDSEVALKNRNEAIKNYLAALSTIETLFAGSLRADDARVNFLATTKDVFDEAAGALAELALANTPAAPAARTQALAHASNAMPETLKGQSLAHAAEAFRIVEQGKARALLDMLGDARAEVREGVPAALLERKAANMARQQEIAGLLGGVTVKSATLKQTVPELEAELEQLTSEFNSLENGIRTSSPRYAALVRTQPLTLAEVQRQVLDDSTVLLEYNLGTNQSYLFAATKTGLTIHRLPSRATVERLAIELRQKLVPAGVRRAIAGINVENTRGLTLGTPSTASANVTAYAAAANALYQTVVAPAGANIGDRRMLIVPDGALNYVPFEALVTDAQGINYSTLSYLVKTNEIVYAPSASVVAAIRQGATRDAGRAPAAAAAAGGGMLVVADPVFDASDERLKGSSQGAVRARDSVQRMALASALADVTDVKGGNLKLVRLDGTRSEADEIAKLARANGGQADVWLDFDASEAKLQERKLDNYRVVHFATHGLLDAERPQFTGLALSLVGETTGDGFLRVEEVFNLRLGSPLVMLSACETGLGKERRGEGVIGLTRAFIYAGAPTVGVSLWSVADKSTSELMPEFYRRLLLAGQSGGGGAPAAMRASQISMIAGKRYSAPFYWAPFVLVGDWR